MILIFSKKNTLVSQIISYRIFTFIGKISYSIYLYHFPIVVFIKYNNFEINHYLKFLIFLFNNNNCVFELEIYRTSFLEMRKIDNKLFFYILSPILLILIIYGFQLHTTNGFEKNYFNKLSDSQKLNIEV